MDITAGGVVKRCRILKKKPCQNTIIIKYG